MRSPANRISGALWLPRQTPCPPRLVQALRTSDTAILGYGDVYKFQSLDFNGSMLDPTSIIKTIGETTVCYHVWVAAKLTLEARCRINSHLKDSKDTTIDQLTTAATQLFLVQYGKFLADSVVGPHFTFVDPRNHGDAAAMIADAERLVALFEQDGLSRERVVVSIPATKEGILAAAELSKSSNIKINLCVVTGGIPHAAACVEAASTTLTVPVGSLFDWYERRYGASHQDPLNNPAVDIIRSTLAYIKLHKLKTKVIGNDFRQLQEISPLSQFDAICVHKEQADAMRWSTLPLLPQPSKTSLAYQSARRAEFPTRYLSHERQFMHRMPADMLSMTMATMESILGRMKADMDKIVEIVGDEVRYQHSLETMDLRALYNSLPRGEEEEEELQLGLEREPQELELLGLEVSSGKPEDGGDGPSRTSNFHTLRPENAENKGAEWLAGAATPDSPNSPIHMSGNEPFGSSSVVR
ncbi:hypothetical protein AX17_007022 [Amanita inopinata Kibby_2008]|nr:hypothetical protein AX17_007022 [Amanita inopinata Kibby_2008]